jgi:adenylosuccinate synthase
MEGGTDGFAHQRIGSTGEGVGVCRIARISRQSLLRGPEFAARLAGDVPVLGQIVRPYRWLNPDDRILLEGTQGSKLSLIHGPWPYTTSADTNAAQLLADSGAPLGAYQKTILVARTFPIRVAGNSGPLPNETTWEAIGQPEERTTVTQKVRRVGEWDAGWVIDAIRLNHPAELVITFLDYLFPETKGMREWSSLPGKALDWLESVQQETGAPVVGVGTGPETVVFRDGYLP